MPLGWRKFFNETGIKESDWKGKYWARWSDAIREAGFSPNQMQSRRDSNVLIEKYIQFTRQLGRFPVGAEMRLQARNDPAFLLNSDTLQNHFGSKSQLISKVTEYCRNQEGYDDIIALCDAHQEKEGIDDEQQEPADTTDHGWVYLLKSGRFHKIGRTNDLARRKGQLAIQLPEASEIIHQIHTDDPAGIEAYWHRRFDAKRKEGEWFELDRQDVSIFRKRRFM